MWRACKNTLPTNYSLKLRRVPAKDACGVCGMVESSGHALWDCEVAKAVWKESKLPLPKFQTPLRDFLDLVWKIWEDRKEFSWESFATTAWCIWKNKNATKFEGRNKVGKMVAREAVLLAEEFSASNTAMALSTAARTEIWKPPWEGWYKVNVDGAVFNELGSCGIGVVIRNAQGQLMGAMSKRLDIPLGATEVEAKAFEEGLLLAGDLGLKYVILEGDAQMVTNALSGKCFPPSSIQVFIAGTKLWRQKVTDWEISYVRRTGNEAAHLMARNAKLVSDCVVWVEDTPPIIQCQVHNDVRLLSQSSSY